MSSKYAKARDTAYQWRAEYRKAQTENRSLRSVLRHAQALSDHLEGDVGPKTLEQLQRALRSALLNARFVVGGPPG